MSEVMVGSLFSKLGSFFGGPNDGNPGASGGGFGGPVYIREASHNAFVAENGNLQQLSKTSSLANGGSYGPGDNATSGPNADFKNNNEGITQAQLNKFATMRSLNIGSGGNTLQIPHTQSSPNPVGFHGIGTSTGGSGVGGGGGPGSPTGSNGANTPKSRGSSKHLPDSPPMSGKDIQRLHVALSKDLRTDMI